MKKLLTVIALSGLMFAVQAVESTQADATAPPARVWVCHGPGHVTTNALVSNTDWIINVDPGDEPDANQRTFCPGKGGELIEVSERGACRGHGANDFHGKTDEC